MQKFTLLLLSLVLLAPLGIDLYLPTLPDIAVGLNTPVSAIQTTIPLFLLVMGLGQIIAGPLVDNLGRKPVALTGLLLYWSYNSRGQGTLAPNAEPASLPAPAKGSAASVVSVSAIAGGAISGPAEPIRTALEKSV